MTWEGDAQRALAELAAAARLREIVDFDAAGPRGTLDGRDVVSFASNDYLGLSFHPAVVAAGREALLRWGAGATAARLIVGSRPIHSRLEAELARWKGAEKALLFPSGYAANVGVLSALATGDTVIVSDRLNHASIIDGCRMARGRVAIYDHGDIDAVAAILEHTERALVVTDAVFSMDGDEAPLAALSGVCARHRALLVVDSAHAVFGIPDLDPSCEVLHVGTLSKFLGAAGGFAAGTSGLVDVVANRARSFIFSTAGSPADAAAALAALDIYLSAEGDELRQRLRRHIEELLPGHPTPIIPVVIGDERAALEAARTLLDDGLLVPAIRPPSVPEGSSRLRVTLSAAHSDEDVDRLRRALARLRARV